VGDAFGFLRVRVSCGVYQEQARGDALPDVPDLIREVQGGFMKCKREGCHCMREKFVRGTTTGVGEHTRLLIDNASVATELNRVPMVRCAWRVGSRPAI
jgi:hypothetical protein